MKIKEVPSPWITRWGSRLDAGPYLSGAVDARMLMESPRFRSGKLSSVTSAIYHAGREGRRWVSEEKYGVPFLSSSDILKADLSDLPLLSKQQVDANPGFVVRKGWTLITRSGTIGRMAYVRSDMDGMACSEHAMRVVPDEVAIAPGYLFAFLRSRYGVPMVIGGTYGSIVQSIEPEHISALPVPRLGVKFEAEIHELVEAAATLRANGAQAIRRVVSSLPETLGLGKLRARGVTAYGTSSISFSGLRGRLDAPYHSAAAMEVEAQLASSRVQVLPISELLAAHFKPPMFKRLWVDDPRYGRQFVSGNDAYRFEAEEIRYVSVKTPSFDAFILKRGWVTFQAAGQIYGLFGKPLLVCGWLEDIFCADDMYRLVPRNEIDGAYLFGFFKTPHGEVLLKRQACGNSIPRVWDPHMRDVQVPWPAESVRHDVAEPILRAHADIETARLKETEAVRLIEQAIEGAA